MFRLWEPLMGFEQGRAFLVSKYYCLFQTNFLYSIRQSIVLIRITTVIQEKTQCNCQAANEYIHL